MNPSSSKARPGRMRWWIVWTLFFSTVTNYISRQTDHEHMLAIVRRTLGEEFEVVGAVEDGKQGVNAVLRLNPDALVIDISMPILNGLQAAKQLQTANCRTKIIFLSIYDGPAFRDAAFSAVAAGYV